MAREKLQNRHLAGRAILMMTGRLFGPFRPRGAEGRVREGGVLTTGGESEDGGGQLLRPAEREKFSAAGLANQRPLFSALDLFFHGQLDFLFFL